MACKTVILSQSEPSDLAGLPVVSPAGDVVLAAPAWARRPADHDGPSICFFDEFSTAQPSCRPLRCASSPMDRSAPVPPDR